MTQDKREQNDKNSAFEFKLRTASVKVTGISPTN